MSQQTTDAPTARAQTPSLNNGEQLEHELQQQRALSRHLERLADIITTSANLDDKSERLLHLFSEVAGATTAVLRLRERDQLRSRAAMGLEGEVSSRFAMLTSEAFSNMEPLSPAALVFSSPKATGPWSSPPFSGKASHGVLALALRQGDNLVGAVYFALDKVTAETQRVLELLARPAAAALSRRQGIDALEDAIRARDDLLAVVAHDLRNPLNVISVSANNVLRRLTDPAVVRPLERILRGATRADRLIRDLLDVNAIESGRFNVERRTVETADLVLAALDSQQGLAADASVMLTSDLTPNMPQVDADEERLLQVLENLIGNAVKFTEPGGVVTVGALSTGREIKITVTDKGPGMPPEQLTKLFDRFWQARKHDRRGTGLGLTICKAIVEAHGGRIWAESKLGEGTTMVFTVPVGQPSVLTGKPDVIFNILLVDDRPENILALKSILQQPSYRLLTATSGEEALRLALREHLDVALIDVAMPGMDGVEVAGHMKALERCRDVPILFVTAFGQDPAEIHRAYAAGGADYLVKPLDADIVRKKVAVFANLRRKHNESPEPTPR
jgi:signal transduction histidine kinase/ActR/RegA family two-component response regulator